jgi:hypothetical protein
MTPKLVRMNVHFDVPPRYDWRPVWSRVWTPAGPLALVQHCTLWWGPLYVALVWRHRRRL